jgi:hypothetical protein
MKCKYCNNIFVNKHTLLQHQTNAKYCLKIRGKVNDIFKCTSCNKKYSTKQNLEIHLIKCVPRKIDINQNEYEKKVKEMSVLIQLLKLQLKTQREQSDSHIETQRDKYENQISNLQDKLENIAIKAVQKPTTTNNTKNIQINNFLKSAPALTDAVIQENIQYLTLEHHVQGAEGYAKYALEFPFKGRIVCVDVSRNKIKYKDGDGNVIEDAGFQKMMMKLCKALYGKSYDLSIEHLEKLSKQFTAKELEQYDYLEAAKAITMYSKGSESDFCKQIIKMISKSASNV